MKDTTLPSNLLQNLKKFISDKDVLHDVDKEISEDKVLQYLLAGLDSSKDIQSGLYSNSQKRGGFVRGIKNIIINKLANITRNVVELPFMHQQKFNDNVYLLLEYLINENIALKEKLKKDGK